MIKPEEVKKIANLAKLHLTDNEIISFSKQLSSIMDMIDQLNQANCNDVTPLTSVSEMNQRTRQDEVFVTNTTDDLFTNIQGANKDFAKEVKCFIVSKVVE